MLKAYTKCIKSLRQVSLGILKSHPAKPNTEKHMIGEWVIICGSFLYKILGRWCHFTGFLLSNPSFDGMEHGCFVWGLCLTEEANTMEHFWLYVKVTWVMRMPVDGKPLKSKSCWYNFTNHNWDFVYITFAVGSNDLFLLFWIEMLMELCDLLHLANHTEKAVAIIQAMLEFNMNRPDNLNTHEDAITSFQLFYDSGNIRRPLNCNYFSAANATLLTLLPSITLFPSQTFQSGKIS